MTHRFGSCGLAGLLGLMLTAVAFAGDRPPAASFTAVRMAKPPVIDGKVEPGEWDDTLTTSGLLAAFDYKLLNAPTLMSLGFDDHKLYFLFRCTRAPGEWRLTKSARSNDDYNFGDPSVEIWVSPPKPVPETYQSIINTYPAVLDMQMIPSRGYTAQGWTGHWDIAVNQTPDQYVIEASIPIADFGIDTIKDGDTWQFLLCRNALGAWPRSQGSWSITTAFDDIAQHPPVRMCDDNIAVQVADTQTLLTGNYKLPVTLVGLHSAQAKATVEIRLHQGPLPGDASDITQSKTVTLNPSERQTVTFDGQVPQTWKQKLWTGKENREMTAGYLTLTVKRDGDQTIFSQTIPYAVTDWTYSQPVRPEKTPEPPPMSVRAQYGPEHNVLLLRTDILDLPQRDKAAGGYVRLLDPADGNKELKRYPLARFIHDYSDTHFTLDGIDVPLQDYSAQDSAYDKIKQIKEENKDRAKRKKQLSQRKPKPGEQAPDLDKDPSLQPLPVPDAPSTVAPRKLIAEVAVTDAQGNVLHTVSQEVNLLRYKFTWQNNSIGVSDKAIAPWSPVQVNGNQFSVWNRKLAVNGLAMLQSVDNGGTQQIRSMRLVAVKNGKEIPINAGKPQIQNRTEEKITFTGSGTGAGLKLSAASSVEMDGYVLSDLTIAPQSDEAQIDNLYLEVVLPESEADYFCATAGGWSAVHDKTPAYWSSQMTGSGVLIGDFVPYIFLTNSERGFLWLADNDKGWITEDQRAKPTQEIIRKDGTVTLRIHFIEMPTKLTAPTTLRYAYQTFPSRPVPGGWRSWVCMGRKVEGAPSARITYFYPNFEGTDWVILWPYYGSPFPHSWDRSMRYFDGGKRSADDRPSVGSIAHSIGRYMDYENRYFPEFSVDWGCDPGIIGNSDVTQSRGPIDFRVYYYDQWVRRSGMRMIYIDENYLGAERNFLSGNAYLRPDGRLQPGYDYLGLRDYYKRLTYALHDAGAEKPNLWMHVSSGAAYSAWWADIFMDGENVAPVDEESDYIQVLPAARMRAIGSAKVAGGAMLMMCQAQRHTTAYSPKHIHQFVGWVMAHDILPEQVYWFAPIAEAARFHLDDVQFIGYWKPENPVKTDTPDCLVSMHRTDAGRRTILWIVNTARQDQPVQVNIDWAKLGLDKSRTIALNAETGRPVSLSDGGLTVDVLKRDFVAVHLIERPKNLPPGISFSADFDQNPEASFAYGSAAFEGDVNLTASDHGKALNTEREITFLPLMNLANDAGTLSFHAQLTAKSGPILHAIAPPPAWKQPAPIGLLLEIQRAQSNAPAQLVLRRDEKDGASIALPLPAPGWHNIELAWNNGQMTLNFDGKPAPGSIPVASLNINEDTGPALLKTVRFVFGGNRGAVTAIDDLIAIRPRK